MTWLDSKHELWLQRMIKYQTRSPFNNMFPLISCIYYIHTNPLHTSWYVSGHAWQYTVNPNNSHWPSVEQAVLVSLCFCFRSQSAGRGSPWLCECLSGWHSHCHCLVRDETFYYLHCPQHLCLHLFIVTMVMRAGKGQIISTTGEGFLNMYTLRNACCSWCLPCNGYTCKDFGPRVNVN